MNGNRLSLIETSNLMWILTFSEKEKIIKAKSFMLGYNKNVKSTEQKAARSEYKKWLETYWKQKYLSNDDFDFFGENA